MRQKVNPEQLAIGGIVAIVAIALFAVALSSILVQQSDIVGFASACTSGTFTGGGCSLSGNYYICSNVQYCSNGVLVSCSGNTCNTGAAAQACGNNVIEGTERCDGTNFGASLNPAPVLCSKYSSEYAADGKTISCSNACQINTLNCAKAGTAFPICGDNIKEGTEQCDDGNKNNGDGCSSTCTTESAAPACGNGNIDTNEQCDGTNLNGKTCALVVGTGSTGTLACKQAGTANACTFDTTSCSAVGGSTTDTQLSASLAEPLPTLRASYPTNALDTNKWLVFASDKKPNFLDTTKKFAEHISGQKQEVIDRVNLDQVQTQKRYEIWVTSMFYSGSTADTFGIRATYADTTNAAAAVELWRNGQLKDKASFNFQSGWNTIVVVVDHNADPLKGPILWSFTTGGNALALSSLSTIPLFSHLNFDYDNNGKLEETGVSGQPGDITAYFSAQSRTVDQLSTFNCIVQKPLDFYRPTERPCSATAPCDSSSTCGSDNFCTAPPATSCTTAPCADGYTCSSGVCVQRTCRLRSEVKT